MTCCTREFCPRFRSDRHHEIYHQHNSIILLYNVRSPAGDTSITAVTIICTAGYLYYITTVIYSDTVPTQTFGEGKAKRGGIRVRRHSEIIIYYNMCHSTVARSVDYITSVKVFQRHFSTPYTITLDKDKYGSHV